MEFVTASDRVPVNGIASIMFVIQRNGVGDAVGVLARFSAALSDLHSLAPYDQFDLFWSNTFAGILVKECLGREA